MHKADQLGCTSRALLLPRWCRKPLKRFELSGAPVVRSVSLWYLYREFRPFCVMSWPGLCFKGSPCCWERTVCVQGDSRHDSEGRWHRRGEKCWWRSAQILNVFGRHRRQNLLIDWARGAEERAQSRVSPRMLLCLDVILGSPSTRTCSTSPDACYACTRFPAYSDARVQSRWSAAGQFGDKCFLTDVSI